MRLLNMNPAATREITATTARGTRHAPFASFDAPRKNNPFITSISQRTGLAIVAVFSHSGILSIGVANPERIIAGGMNKKTPNIACCCVVAAALIINPTLTIDVKYNTVHARNRANVPCNGILKPKITIAVESKAEHVAKRTDDIVLPATISVGVAGETINCSNVPISRSRAIENEETIKPTVVVIRQINPGINELRDIKFGLNQRLAIGPIETFPPSGV